MAYLSVTQSAVGVGDVLAARFRLGEELARVGSVTVFRATDELEPDARFRTVGVTVTMKHLEHLSLPPDSPGGRVRTRTWLAAIQPSAVGSKRRVRINPGDILVMGMGGNDALDFKAWALFGDGGIPPPRRHGGFMAATKRSLLKEAKGCCRWCGSTQLLEFDHVLPVDLGGTHDLRNGQVLCRGCHRAKTHVGPSVRVFAPPFHGAERSDPCRPWYVQVNWVSVTGSHQAGKLRCTRTAAITTLGPYGSTDDARQAGHALAVQLVSGLRWSVSVDPGQAEPRAVQVTVTICEPTTSYALRPPTRLLKQVEALAAREQRSINAQLTYLIERGLEMELMKRQRQHHGAQVD
jgi:hypothetical protein